MAIRKRTGKRGVTWQIDYYDPNGKRVRANYRLKKDAEAELGKRVSLIAEGSYLDRKKTCDVTFGQMVERYTAEYEDQASFRCKRYYLREFKAYFGKDTPLDKIKYADVKGYHTGLKRTLTKWGKPRTEAAVNRCTSCLRHLFREAVELEIIESSPFSNKKSLVLKENNIRDRFLSQEEINRFLATSMPEYVKNTCICMLHTGTRRGETLALPWEQVRDGLVYLRAEQTKTRVARQVPIDDDLTAHLAALRRRYGLRSKYVICDTEFNRINPRRFSKALESALKRANIEDCTAHTFRHTFASHFVMRGGDLPSLSKILGHKDIKMTMRYAHLAKSHVKNAIIRMNGLTGQKSDQKVTNHSHHASIVSHVSQG